MLNLKSNLRFVAAAAVMAVAQWTQAQEQPADSLPAPKPFARDIEMVRFVPKGQWITGVSVGYSQSSQNNYQFLILEGLNADTYSFKLSPLLMYAFADNLSAGGRFAYQRTRTRLDNASIVLDSSTSYDVEHLYMISHSYYGTAVFRNYLSLGRTTRFGMFNEVQLGVGGGQSKVESGTGLDFTGTYERSVSLDIGVAPGMLMFLNNYTAIECNVGVLGFNYNNVRSVTDRIHIANRTTKSANFRVNLFSIMFGCIFYI